MVFFLFMLVVESTWRTIYHRSAKKHSTLFPRWSGLPMTDVRLVFRPPVLASQCVGLRGVKISWRKQLVRQPRFLGEPVVGKDESRYTKKFAKIQNATLESIIPDIRSMLLVSPCQQTFTLKFSYMFLIPCHGVLPLFVHIPSPEWGRKSIRFVLPPCHVLFKGSAFDRSSPRA